MLDKQPVQRPPLLASVSAAVLKLLVFAAFAFVLYEATAVHGSPDLSASWTWVIIADMGCMLLLLGIDRLIELQVTSQGVEAKLAQAQSQALAEVGAMEDTQVAQAAREQILQAKNAGQVESALAIAVELNVSKVIDRVKEAIRQKRRMYVRYRSGSEELLQVFEVAPLDVRPGKSKATRAHDYLWIYSFEHGHILSLRLERVLSAEMSEEMFDPDGIIAGWKEGEWNVPREW